MTRGRFHVKSAGAWLPPILCAVIIFYLSSRPARALPRLWFPNMDKIIHAGEYGALALLLYRAWFWPRYWIHKSRPRLIRGAAFIALICALFALSDEIHQAFVPGRAMTLADWIADMTGALAALGFCLWRALPQTASASLPKRSFAGPVHESE